MYSLHRGPEGGANSTTACITSLRVVGKKYYWRILVWRFQPDGQTAKFNSCQMFSGYSVLHIGYVWVTQVLNTNLR